MKDIPALEKAIAGVDAIINAYAPHPLLDLDGHLLLLRAAERANITIFIASSWSRDWTNIKFGDFEHYDDHIAFETQAAKTNSIKPVYLITGFDASGEMPHMKYWGNGDTDIHPWSTIENAAKQTIDILLYGEGVQAGKGGFFKIHSGETSVKELAAVYEKAKGSKVEVTRGGSMDDLEAELARLRTKGGRTRYREWMAEVAAVIGSERGWR